MTTQNNRYVSFETVEPIDANAFLDSLGDQARYRPTIGGVIPACNEADSIAEAAKAPPPQARPPDVIHVIVNNSTDATAKMGSQYAGAHTIEIEGEEQFT